MVMLRLTVNLTTVPWQVVQNAHNFASNRQDRYYVPVTFSSLSKDIVIILTSCHKEYFTDCDICFLKLQ